MMKKALLWIAGIIAAGAVCYGVYVWTISMGHDTLTDLARERGLCTTAECNEGAETITALLSDQFGMSQARFEWCLGVDEWAKARVQRGGFVKSILVEIMYTPCGPLFVEGLNGQ
jgi:hypothetical protein